MMRIILFFLLSTSICTAQDNNFSYKNNNILWEKVFHDSVSIQDLLNHIKLSGKIEAAETSTGIDFKIRYIRNDFEKYGYKYMSDALFFKNGGTCTGTIEFKEGKYKVTLFSFDINDPAGTEKTDPLHLYIIKKGDFKKNQVYARALSYYNSFFTDFFTYKTKEDW